MGNNGNVTSQTADTGATYSWTGEEYDVPPSGGEISDGLIASIDPAASFCAFGGGGGENPSHTPVAFPFKGAKIYVPDQMGGPPNTTAYDYDWVKSVWDYALGDVKLKDTFVLDFKMYFYPNNQPTEKSFITSLNTTNIVLAFLDHGFISMRDGKTAIGLLFPDVNLFSQDLVNSQQVSVSGDVRQSVTPNTRVIFLSICGFTDAFKPFWNMNRAGHALVYPTYFKSNKWLHIDQGFAPWDFEGFLFQMGLGHSVGRALTTAISSAVNQNEQTSWACQGDNTVAFLPINTTGNSGIVPSATPCQP